MRRTLAVVVPLVVLVVGCKPLLLSQSSQTATVEHDAVVLVNQHRAANGQPAVGVDAELTLKARQWAQYMSDGGCGRGDDGTPKICHSNLTYGVTEWSWLGEVVAMCYCDQASAMHQMFVNSAPHNAIMLEPVAKWVGVGVWHNSNGQWYIAEVFKA
jgi:uncharacterized protein YkwD